MNRTNIEWVRNPDGTQGYTWNPITGCMNHINGMCKGGNFPCYAYKLANGRLLSKYLNNQNVVAGKYNLAEFEKAINDPFYPRFWDNKLFEPVNKIRAWGRQTQVIHSQRPKGIFVCDMSDLFGIGIPEEWTRRVLDRFQYAPQHRFYLLTKQPQNLIKWSPFPDNCWVGVTATTTKQFADLFIKFQGVRAKVRFISFEPLLEWSWNETYKESLAEVLSRDKENRVDWVIIGSCTGTREEIFELYHFKGYSDLKPMPYGRIWTLQPKVEWMQEIVEACDKAGIPVFLKDNLKPLLESDHRTFMNPLYWKNGYYTSPEHPNIDLHLRQGFPK